MNRRERRAEQARARRAVGRQRAAAERRRIAEGGPVVPRPAPTQQPISPPPTATHSHAREDGRRQRQHGWPAVVAAADLAAQPAAEEPAP